MAENIFETIKKIDDNGKEYWSSEKGSSVHIVSSAKRVRSGPRYFTSRFSSKLRKLTEERGKPVDFLNIDNLKMRIRKDI